MNSPSKRSRSAAQTDAPLAPAFTVAIDTREQLPYSFAGILADACQGRRPLAVPTVRATLAQGDYSVLGMESRVAVERKSLEDLFGTIGQGRARFVRELERLDACVKWSCVMVESDWWTILTAPPVFSQLQPKTVFRSILAWMQRYPRVHWLFMRDRRLAEITTFRILERAWKEAQRAE